jgi:hypothetical protein
MVAAASTLLTGLPRADAQARVIDVLADKRQPL